MLYCVDCGVDSRKSTRKRGNLEKNNQQQIIILSNEKNTNLYKTILNNLLKLNVSGEILPFSNFWRNLKKMKKWKKVVFVNVSKTTLRN